MRQGASSGWGKLAYGAKTPHFVPPQVQRAVAARSVLTMGLMLNPPALAVKPRTSVRTLAMLGNHTPRQCGIATFTTDLSDAITAEFPQLDCFVVAMNDAGKHHGYPDKVRFEIADHQPDAYRRAADFLNFNTVDVLSVQHEYGIYGARSGAPLLSLLRELRMPIVTTLHTILGEPNREQRAVMDELTQLSERLVVMSQHGAELLQSVHGVPERKIDFIPHGIPTVVEDGRSKDRLGLFGQSVVLTFGLLAPDKGLEFVIDALPEVLKAIPNVMYVVVGATHPHVKEHHGESYRHMLEDRAKRLGVDGHVVFHNRFVSLPELTEFLSAADLYVTPYLKAEQITSGTLAYAVGSGKAVISTPYVYAREVLADGRGVLVPSHDAAALANAMKQVLGDGAQRQSMQRRAAKYGRGMRWPVVAQRYVHSLERAKVDHAERLRGRFRAPTLARRAAPPEVNLEHLRLMTDDTGVLQHARYGVPRYDEGYCVDDNARALLLVTLIEDAGEVEPKSVRALTLRYLAFLSHAYNAESHRFRNFMSYSRQWLDETGSEDSHGRALWALGTVVGRSTDPGRVNLAGTLFHSALSVVSAFHSPRAWAFTLLGLNEYLRAFTGDTHVQALRSSLALRLYELFERSSTPTWPWFEPQVTYSNARLPQALMLSGVAMQHDAMVKAGLASLRWLVKVQTTADQLFAPIGTNGFLSQGGVKAEFDQQPVEACSMVSACLSALHTTKDAEWSEHARRAFMWFFGQNQLRQPLYDARTGGCRDGLHPDRVNENQGAESTLSCLLALQEMRVEARAGPSVERAQVLLMVPAVHVAAEANDD